MKDERTATPMSSLVVGLGALVVAIHAGCTDPVRDQQIEALGPEAAGVPPGEMHRPGQPCLPCHSSGGPAASSPFAVAGTIFKTAKFDSEPASEITVQFVDANGGAPRVSPVTNEAGNFWVPVADWPDLAFPVRVGLYTDKDAAPTQTMKSLINREGSCNFCHHPTADPSQLSDEQSEGNKQYTGQIYAESG